MVFRRNYFVFGVSYNECSGDCTHYYLLTDGKIYPDNVDNSRKKIKYKNVSMSDDKYRAAKKLQDALPDYLLDHPNETFGCPDCSDQGAIEVQLMKKGKLIKWHIDSFRDKQPAEIQDYIAEMKQVLQSFRN
jgi:hypothetical protein